MLKDNQVGTVAPDGTRTPPEVSAISGKTLAPGDVTITFPGSNEFVGVRGVEWRGMTPAEKLAIRAELQRQLPTTAPVTESSEPSIDALSSAELDTVAASEGIDLAGRKSKADKVDAITAGRVMKRFSSVPIPPESEATQP